MYSFLLMEIIFLLLFTQNNECMNVFIPSHGNNILSLLTQNNEFVNVFIPSHGNNILAAFHTE